MSNHKDDLKSILKGLVIRGYVFKNLKGERVYCPYPWKEVVHGNVRDRVRA